MRRRQVACSIFLALALAACSKSKDNTQLVITVWSDLVVPGEMDALRIRVMGKEQTIDHPFRLSSSQQPGTFQIPVQLALVPAGNRDLLISVAAIGSYQGTDIVSQEALLPFIPDQARELVLYLGRSCKNIFCADHPGYTCENGACTKLITTDTAALPTYVPGRPSGSPDAGPTSSGTGGITRGTGGVVGSGGAKGTGGMVGSGGAKGTGGIGSTGGTTGSGGADGTLCPLPNRALITDFTDAPLTSSDPTQPRFAISGGLQGGLTLYPTSGSYPLTASVAQNNWHITGTVGDYSGIALYFDSCDRLDASKYKGISFTISGAVRDNSIVLGVESSANKPSAAWLISKGDTKAKEGDSGRCTPTSGDGPYFHPGCTAATARLSPSSSPTVHRVYWSDLTGGEPDSSPQPTEITSIYWLFPWSAGSPPYPLDITLDDLNLIEEGPGTSTGGSGGGGAGGTGGSGGTSVPSGTGGIVTFSSGKAVGVVSGEGWVALGRDTVLTTPTCGPENTRITSSPACQTTYNWPSTNALCVSGTIPVVASGDYDNNWGVQIGANVTEPPGGMLGQSYSTITFNYTGALTPSGASVRAELHRSGDPVGSMYCATITSGVPVLLTAFNTACWDGTGTRLQPADIPRIDQIGLQVCSDASRTYSLSNFCWNSFELGPAQGGEGSGKNILDLVPVDNGVSGWRVDRVRNPSGGTQPMTATTFQETVGLIDGAAESFFMPPYTPREFAWQNYLNSTLPTAPDGAYLSLYVFRMPSAEQAAGLYRALLQASEYSRKAGTPDDWQPTSPSVGTESRVQDTGTAWWINFHQDVFYVEVMLDPSYGPAPDYTPGNATAKVEALRFAQAVASAIGTGGGTGGSGGSSGGAVKVDQPLLNFGTVDVGAVSAQKVVTVTVTGAAAPINATVTGAGFAISASTCAATQPVGTCTISVVFAPIVAGAASGILAIGAVQVALSGTGAAPGTFTVTPGSIPLGTLLVGSSATATVTIVPTGILQSIVCLASGADLALASQTCPLASPVSVPCTYAFTFKATSAGAKSAAIVCSGGGVTATATVTANVV